MSVEPDGTVSAIASFTPTDRFIVLLHALQNVGR